MPSVWQVRVDSGDVGMWTPKALHNQVSRWLNERDGDGIGVPHDAPKPYAVRGVRRLGSSEAAVEIGLLDDALGEVLVGRAVRGTAVECGFWSGSVIAVSEVDHVGWDEICSVVGDSRWVVTFRTPATFRSGQVYAPWPDPITVITGVHRRLRAVYPVGFDDLALMRSDTVWVSRCRADTVLAEVKAGSKPGFVGEVTYQADPRWPGLGEVEKVFRAARLAGVGAHTAYGLGVVDVQASRTAGRRGPRDRTARAQ